MPDTGDAQLQAQNPAAAALQDKFNQGTALHQQGRLAEAERIYRHVLRLQPNHFGALHLLGLIALQTRHTQRAIELIGKAIGLNGSVAAAHSNLGKALLDLKRPEDALASYDKAIALEPDFAEAHYNRGLTLQDLKRSEDALASYNRAIALEPDFAEAYNNRGMVLMQLKRPEDALANFDKAIALKPDYAMAHNNRGMVLMQLKRPEDALASCDKAIALTSNYSEAYHNRGMALFELKRPEDALASYDKAIALKPELSDTYCKRGNALSDLKRYAEALASYDMAIALKPDYAEAYSNRGLTLQGLNRPTDALASCDKAIALKSDFAWAYCNRAAALLDLKRPEEALASYDKAIALKPDYAEAYYNRGYALANLKRYDEALAAYDKAFALKSDLTAVEGNRLHAKMRLCDWSNFDTECAHLISSIRNGTANTTPFVFLTIPSSSAEQLQCAKLWVANKFPSSHTPIWQGKRYDHNRIRVAYLSPDFREHPLSFLMAGVFECHDKSRFDVTAISCGPDDNSEIRQRLIVSCERFIDAKTYGDDYIAKLLKELEVDIFVDLAGFTFGSRTRVFTKRPAPIQVNFLGYPGTMGTQDIDYIVADRIVLSESQHKSYSEKIVYLPNSYYPTSYQVNESKSLIADKRFTRAELGLPLMDPVFCCFNNNYKVTPRIFDRWMQILKQVEGSVLWLLEDNPTAASNLKKEAVTRGVYAERLIFAKRVPPRDHLARHRLADLFLDTLPYNGHTTASDALWAGVPVLTCLGETFAGRVAASLLHAIGLPELITTTLDAYEQMAIDLATHPEKLGSIKRKLADKSSDDTVV